VVQRCRLADDRLGFAGVPDPNLRRAGRGRGWVTFSLSGRAGQLGAVRLVQELGLFVGLDFTRRAGVCRRLIGKAIMSLVPTGTATDDQGAARPEVRSLRLMRLPRVNSLPWDNAL